MTVHQLPSAEELARSAAVHRYVAGGMSEIEMQEFELELMRSTSLQLDVEAELALREHAGTMAATESPDRKRSLARSQRAAIAFALAASLATGWFLNTLLVKPSLPKDSLAVVEISQQRGPSSSSLAPADSPFVARLLTADDQIHRVVLLDNAGQTLQQWRAVKPSADGYLSLIFPALDPAHAPFQVQLRSDSGFEQDLSLELGEVKTP